MWVCRFWKYRTCFYKCVRSGSIHTYFNVRWGYRYSHTPSEAVLETKTYQPMRSNLIFLKMTLSSGFVKISASWSFVSIEKMEIVLSATCFQKWWYLIEIWFVLCVNFELSATLLQLLLSSNTLQWNSGLGSWRGKTSPTLTIKFMKGINYIIAWDIAMYSDYFVLKAISVCSLLAWVPSDRRRSEERRVSEG